MSLPDRESEILEGIRNHTNHPSDSIAFQAWIKQLCFQALPRDNSTEVTLEVNSYKELEPLALKPPTIQRQRVVLFEPIPVGPS